MDLGLAQVAVDQQHALPELMAVTIARLIAAVVLPSPAHGARHGDGAERPLRGERIDAAAQGAELLGDVGVGLQQRDAALVDSPARVVRRRRRARQPPLARRRHGGSATPGGLASLRATRRRLPRERSRHLRLRPARRARAAAPPRAAAHRRPSPSSNSRLSRREPSHRNPAAEPGAGPRASLQRLSGASVDQTRGPARLPDHVAIRASASLARSPAAARRRTRC